MKSCADVRENISAYVDGELSADEKISFEEHINSCPDCKKELDEMMQIIRLCSNMPLQQLPEGFRDELHEKLTAVAARSKNIETIGKPRKIPHAKTFASIAAGILLVFIGGSIVRYGLLSGNLGAKNDAGNSYQLAEKSSETAADSGEDQHIAFSLNADSTEDGSAAAGIQSMDNGEANQSLTYKRSNDNNRSSSAKARSEYNALGVTETANCKSSEITIMADEPETAVETVTELASANNGAMTDEQAGYSGVQDSSEDGNDALDGDETRIQLQMVFSQDDYKSFTNAVNDAFGAANVQIGPFITEDMTDKLNALIEQTEIYDNDIKELQKENSESNEKKIQKLKKEKEEIVRQIETIRLNSDFVTVQVNINER